MTRALLGTAAQPATPRLRFATTRLATGLRVHYAEQGDPDGEVILFLHGYTDSWHSYSRLLPLLPARYRAYAIDQRGHGDSERPVDGYAVDDLAADVVAFLDAVGAPQATIVGHSGGTITGRRVAELYPERVNRLVLIASAILGDNEVTRELEEAVRALEDPVPAEFAREFQTSCIHVPVPKPFLERAVAESLKLPARVWQSALAGLLAYDDRANVGRISAPTLLLAGDRDAYFPVEDQERLAAAIPGARLTVYAETGHSVQWERPERVAADLEAFIQET